MRKLTQFIGVIALMISFINAQNATIAQNTINSQNIINAQNLQSVEILSNSQTMQTPNSQSATSSQNTANPKEIQKQIQLNHQTQGLDSKEVEALYIQRAQKEPRTPCKRKFCPQDNAELKALVHDERVHLGDIDTSAITDMSGLFYDEVGNKAVEIRTNYKGIEFWDTSSVRDMSRMFAYASSFNEPIGHWSVANVKTMREMFLNAINFNQALNLWNVAGVEDMRGMFCYALAFNQPLDKWNVRNALQMGTMFEGAKAFNQPLDKWQPLSATDIGADMFVASPLEFKPPKWYKDKVR